MARKKAAPKPKPVTLDTFGAALAANLKIARDNPEALDPPEGRVGNPVNLGPLVPDAADWAKKMVDRAMASGDAWLQGTLHPTKEPLAAAIASNDRYKQRTLEALNEDRWVKAMKATDEAMMYQIIEASGPGAYTGGVNSRRVKIEAAVGRLQPKVLALKRTIEGMANVSDADREARMIASLRGMREIGKQLKAGG